MTELIEMELARIIISEINDQQVLFLSEKEGKRMFPILVGLFEATRLDERLRNEIPPRPLTHELIKNVIEQLNGEPLDIVINSLHEHTYYAIIRIQLEKEVAEVDARPSDAIALAMHYDPPLPIFVEEDVLAKAAH